MGVVLFMNGHAGELQYGNKESRIMMIVLS